VGTYAEPENQEFQRQVSYEEVQKYAAIRMMKVKEVFIKNFEEVERLFKELTLCIIGKIEFMK
jgi:hypothetical protein